jgi:hypothetical protein
MEQVSCLYSAHFAFESDAILQLDWSITAVLTTICQWRDPFVRASDYSTEKDLIHHLSNAVVLQEIYISL